MPHIMTSSQRSTDVTALITTYNQDLQSALSSIASAVLQNDLSVQILIADDCSNVDPVQVYTQFLDYLGHRNYRIVRHKRNVQTVRNIAEALPAVRSPFVKCFGAGDLLFSFDTLSASVAKLSNSHTSGGFGRIVTFSNGASSGRPFLAPRNPERYNENKSIEKQARLFAHQMLTADWIPAGSQFWRTEVLYAILNILSKEFKVRYCEDFAMSLMLFDAVPCYLDAPILWYKLDGGISTGGSTESIKRLYQDHSNFYSEAAKNNPFRMHLRAARLGFSLRRFIALHTPTYRALQAKVAMSYQDNTKSYPYNELFIEAHNLAEHFIDTRSIEY